MVALRDAIKGVLAEDHPMTIRQVFYRMVPTGLIEKTEPQYKGTICRLLGEMRISGEVPFHHITDGTRQTRRRTTWHSAQEFAKDVAEAYRRNLWDTQQAQVQVWVEKDALSGVLFEETRKWDVPLFVTRGFSSITQIYEAAYEINSVGKPAFVYHFGDHDPAGYAVGKAIEEGIRGFTRKGIDVEFERVAVNRDQIEEFGLTTRPTKRTDSRSRDFKGDSVEVDGIPSKALRGMLGSRIEQHIDQRALMMLRQTERLEAQTFKEFAQGFDRAR